MEPSASLKTLRETLYTDSRTAPVAASASPVAGLCICSFRSSVYLSALLFVSFSISHPVFCFCCVIGLGTPALTRSRSGSATLQRPQTAFSAMSPRLSPHMKPAQAHAQSHSHSRKPSGSNSTLGLKSQRGSIIFEDEQLQQQQQQQPELPRPLTAPAHALGSRARSRSGSAANSPRPHAAVSIAASASASGVGPSPRPPSSRSGKASDRPTDGNTDALSHRTASPPRLIISVSRPSTAGSQRPGKSALRREKGVAQMGGAEVLVIQ